jgi:hypothetical protein
MNNKHNFGFDTELKIFKADGKIKDIIENHFTP